MYSTMKRFLLGRPLATHEEEHQRLPKLIALAVFASDAISSTAYATEEILLVLVPVAGMAALADLVPIAIVVTILLAIVVTSYRQTIHAYPQGGGAYVVSRENLGTTPSLVAGSALLVDYVLTVAVSVSAGVFAITSAFPELADQRVPLCLGFIGLMMVANLRGTKESGRLFAGPTYLYITMLTALIVIGLVRSYLGDLDPLAVDEESLAELTERGRLVTGITAFALLRAFSSGAVALSGVEAISNGVPAFRKPEAKNAGTTLVWMGLILGSLFFGISVLAHRVRPTVSEHETVLSVLGGAVFGDGTAAYFTLQLATFAILILAANPAYADFPRLSSFIARDGFLPRQLANRGDRLVYSNGVIALSVLAGVLIIAFDGLTAALIPLYAVGVFTGFTLSQSGMVVHHWRDREPQWQRGLLINGIGAFATGVVLLVVVVSKFTIGAWIPAVVIPIIAIVLRRIRHHYDDVASALRIQRGYRPSPSHHSVIVLVGGVHRSLMPALAYASSLRADDLIALHVSTDPEHESRLRRDWEEHGLDLPLTVRESPYRELTRPVLEFLDEIRAAHPDGLITVVVPEFIVEHWYANLLHNQSALALRARLRQQPGTVVVSVPLHLGSPSPIAP
jgi:amino acid transporter